jgi:hypothetical protein
MYYLNAIYKEQKELTADDFTEDQIKALIEQQTIVINTSDKNCRINSDVLYEALSPIGYIVKSNGFWSDKTVLGPFKGFKQLEAEKQKLKNEGLVEADGDFTVYINLDDIHGKIEQLVKDKYYDKIDTHKLEIVRDDVYEDNVVETISLIKTIKNKSDLLVNNQPRMNELLNWTDFSENVKDELVEQLEDQAYEGGNLLITKPEPIPDLAPVADNQLVDTSMLANMYNPPETSTAESTQEVPAPVQEQTEETSPKVTLDSMLPKYFSCWSFTIKLIPYEPDYNATPCFFESIAKNTLKKKIEEAKQLIIDTYTKTETVEKTTLMYVYNENGEIKNDFNGTPLIDYVNFPPDGYHREYVVSTYLDPNFPYKKLYIDTINYNEYDKKISQLKTLRAKYSELPDDQESEADKEIEKQKLDKSKVCDKWFPLDLTKLFNIDWGLPSLCTVNIIQKYYDGSNQKNYKYDSSREIDALNKSQQIEETNEKIRWETILADRDKEDKNNAELKAGGKLSEKQQEESEDKREAQDEEHEEILENIQEKYDELREIAKTKGDGIKRIVGYVTNKNYESVFVDFPLTGCIDKSLANSLPTLLNYNGMDFVQTDVYEEEPVAIQDGYAYVPIGEEVTMQYLLSPPTTSTVTKIGVGIEAGAILGGLYVPATGKDEDIMKKYPYENDNPDGNFWWLETSLPDFSNLLKIGTPEEEPITVTFTIFYRQKLDCGFPKKCGNITADEQALNGKCGLQSFLTTPLEIKPRDPALFKGTNITLKSAKREFIQKMKNAGEDAWNFTKNLGINKFNKLVSRENFMYVAKSMFPAMSFIPQECLQEVCTAIRKSTSEDSIANFSQSIKKQLTEASGNADLLTNSVKEASTDILGSFGKIGSGISEGVTNLAKNFNLFQLCPRRFSDYIKESTNGMFGGFKDLATQLQTKFGDGLIGTFSGLLNTCVTKNLVSQSINLAENITSSTKFNLEQAYKNGDIQAFENILKDTPGNFKDKFMSAGTNTLSFTNVINTPSFNFNQLTGLKDSFKGAFGNITNIKNSSDAFKFMKNLRDAEYATDNLIYDCKRELESLDIDVIF